MTSSHDFFFPLIAVVCLIAGAIYSEDGDVIVHGESSFASNSAGENGGEHGSFLQIWEENEVLHIFVIFVMSCNVNVAGENVPRVISSVSTESTRDKALQR